MFEELAHAYNGLVEHGPALRSLILVGAGLVAGWWVYVPAHELLHAAGCWMGGGEVQTLQIQPRYGGHLIAELLPFVSPEGDYAGRLIGFDTRGSDWTYALTVMLPFLLGFPGFWAIGRSLGSRSAFVFGFGLPASLSPVLSVTGDFLEFSGIMLFQVWPGSAQGNRRLITDDLFRLPGEFPTGAWTWDAVLFVVVAQVMALILALLIVSVTSKVAGFESTRVGSRHG